MFSIKFQRLQDDIYVNLKNVFDAYQKPKLLIDYFIKKCNINLVFDNYMLLNDLLYLLERGYWKEIFSGEERDELFEFLNVKLSSISKKRINQLAKFTNFIHNPSFNTLPRDITDKDILTSLLKEIEVYPKKYLKHFFGADEKWAKFFETLHLPCETDLEEYNLTLNFPLLGFNCEKNEIPYFDKYTDIEYWREKEFNDRFKKLFKELNLPIEINFWWIDFYGKEYLEYMECVDKEIEKKENKTNLSNNIIQIDDWYESSDENDPPEFSNENEEFLYYAQKTREKFETEMGKILDNSKCKTYLDISNGQHADNEPYQSDLKHGDEVELFLRDFLLLTSDKDKDSKHLSETQLNDAEFGWKTCKFDKYLKDFNTMELIENFVGSLDNFQCILNNYLEYIFKFLREKGLREEFLRYKIENEFKETSPNPYDTDMMDFHETLCKMFHNFSSYKLYLQGFRERGIKRSPTFLIKENE